MATVPQGTEVPVPFAENGDAQVLQVAVIGSRANKSTAGSRSFEAALHAVSGII